MATPAGFIPDAPAGFKPEMPPAGPPPSAAPAPSAPPSREDIVTRALRGAGPLAAPLAVMFTPGGGQAVKETAQTTIPVAAGALTGGASIPAQALLQTGVEALMQGAGIAPRSNAQLVASGALPVGLPLLGRLARGIPRSITRLIPSRFRGAQQAAQEAGEQVAAKLEPEVVTGEAFKGVRAAGAERIPAAKLQAMLDDLEESIPKDPTSPGLKTARELMDQARASISGGQASLGDLMKLRLDVGRSLKRGPEVAALYKGILGDLEQAGASGGPGAALAMKALEAGRHEHGAQLFRDLVEKASGRRSNLTGDLPLLDMAQLAKLVQTNKDTLVKQLGPEGVGQIEQFLVRFRALPPVDAYNFANKMALGGAGAAGFFGGGGLLPALGTAGLYELLNNAKAVGRNPAELNRFLIMLGEGTRGGLGGAVEAAGKR